MAFDGADSVFWLRSPPCTVRPFPLHAHHAFPKTEKVIPMADYADPENTLVIETTKGNVVIALRPDLAPNHVAHIKKLAREKFYDGVVFHRVIDGFMAQTGDPRGTGTGGSHHPDLDHEIFAEPPRPGPPP